MSNLLTIFSQIIDETDIKSLPRPEITSSTTSRVLQLVFAIAGAISLLIVMIAAFQYVVSQGEPQATAKAKNTILYALIGLVVCATAFSIVTFVLDSI